MKPVQSTGTPQWTALPQFFPFFSVVCCSLHASLPRLATISPLLHYLSYHGHDQLVGIETQPQENKSSACGRTRAKRPGQTWHTELPLPPPPLTLGIVQGCNTMESLHLWAALPGLTTGSLCSLAQPRAPTHTLPAKQSFRTCYKCVY